MYLPVPTLARYLRLVGTSQLSGDELFGNVEISLILFRRDVFDTMSVESKRVSE